MLVPRRSKATIALAVLMSLAWGSANAAEGGVFCRSGKNFSATFAGQVQPDGRLKFGFSAWNEHGDLTLITGFAVRRASHWQLTKKLESADERERCNLRIEFERKSGVRLTTDQAARCVDDGGLGRVDFAAKDYQGPVTIELNDPIDMVEDPAGLLGKGKCREPRPQ